MLLLMLSAVVAELNLGPDTRPSQSADCQTACRNALGCMSYTTSVYPDRSCFLNFGQLDRLDQEKTPAQYIDQRTTGCFYENRVCVDSFTDGYETLLTSVDKTLTPDIQNIVLSTNGSLSGPCPMLRINSDITSLTLKNIQYTCENRAPLVELSFSREIIFTATQVRTVNETVAIKVVGGNVGNPTWFFMDLPKMTVSDVWASSGIAFAGANVQGSGSATNSSAIVVQPEGDFVLSVSNTEFIDISKFTAVFGASYEAQFFNPQIVQSEPNDLLAYGTYSAVTLVILLFIFHQDILLRPTGLKSVSI